MGNATNVTYHPGQLTQNDRSEVTGSRGVTVWMTGLSGSGKSTVAVALEKALVAQGIAAFRLDGDNIRHGLCTDLGFTAEERRENVHCSFWRRTKIVEFFQCDLVPIHQRGQPLMHAIKK